MSLAFRGSTEGGPEESRAIINFSFDYDWDTRIRREPVDGVLSPVYSTNNTEERRARLADRVARVMIACAGVLVVTLLLLLGLALYIDRLASSLPDLRDNPSSLFTERTTVVYAADGSTLAEWHGEQDRTIVPYSEMPTYLHNAVVAVEDQRFYEHHGIDPRAIARALGGGGETGRVEPGGSTITQQVVKNMLDKGERTIWLKIRDALLANALEGRNDKAAVLEIYLNTVYLGRGYYGVESAARHYFGKTTQALSLAEAATIAGIIKSPAKYSPLDYPEAARARRDRVLEEMVRQGYITPEQEREASKDSLKLRPETSLPPRAPYFVEYVKQDLIERFGAERVYTGGLRVFTTLDPAMQSLAEEAARTLGRKGDPEVALVAVRHTDGHVVALVGGKDFSENQFNLAVQGRRQPGSAFKPFVLATALQQGIRPSTKFSAAPYSVKVKDGVWKVQNYENEHTTGRLTLSAATNWSVNGVYARLIMRVGPDNVVKTAKKMGIVTPLDPDPAIALGGLRVGVSPLEMASAYGTIANKGTAVSPTGVVRVLDDLGMTIYQPEQSTRKAIGRNAAGQAATMLHNVVQKGTGVKAKIGRWAAGKTGTTQSYRDAWFVGWSRDISTAVWVGHRDGQVAMLDVHGIKVTGGSFPARIWAEFMRPATRGGVSDSKSGPETTGRGQVLALVCTGSGELATSRCPVTEERHLDARIVALARTCTAH